MIKIKAFEPTQVIKATVYTLPASSQNGLELTVMVSLILILRIAHLPIWATMDTILSSTTELSS